MRGMGMTITGEGRLWFQATSGQRYPRISCGLVTPPLPLLRIIRPLRWLLKAWLLQEGCAGAGFFSPRKLVTGRVYPHYRFFLLPPKPGATTRATPFYPVEYV